MRVDRPLLLPRDGSLPVWGGPGRGGFLITKINNPRSRRLASIFWELPSCPPYGYFLPTSLTDLHTAVLPMFSL